MMIDGTYYQTSHLLPMLTKMKRNLLNDNDDELISRNFIKTKINNNEKISSPCKKLKFGVDTILGNISTHSDSEFLFETGNDSDDELRHKVHIHVESPVSTDSSLSSTEPSIIQSSLYKQPFPTCTNSNLPCQEILNNNQQLNPFQIAAINRSHHPSLSSNPLWRPIFRPFINNYFGNNNSLPILNGTISGNERYVPSTGSNIFWPLGFRTKTYPRMLRRAVFSDQQRKGLEIAFLKQKYIGKTERKKLAQRLDLKDSQVKIWFQNRRMKWRNTKDRKLNTPTDSINIDNNDLSNDCYDCQQKEEIITFHSSINNNDKIHSDIEENNHSRKEELKL